MVWAHSVCSDLNAQIRSCAWELLMSFNIYYASPVKCCPQRQNSFVVIVCEIWLSLVCQAYYIVIILTENMVTFKQTAQRLTRCHIKWRIIWVCTMYHVLFRRYQYPRLIMSEPGIILSDIDLGVDRELPGPFILPCTCKVEEDGLSRMVIQNSPKLPHISVR